MRLASRMRTVSIVEAHRTIRRARAACAAPVAASTNITPPARPPRPPGIRWLTAAPVRTCRRPVARAAAMLVPTLFRRGLTAAVTLQRQPARRDQPPVGPGGRHAVAQAALRPRQRPRAHVAPVRELRQALPCAVDAQEALDPVVVRGQIAVADRPARPVAVALGGLQLVVRQAQRHPAPEERASAELPAADPDERPVRRRGVALLLVLHEQVGILDPVLAVQLLHSLRAARVTPQARRPRPAGSRRLPLRPRFQQQHAQSGLAEFLGRPAAGRAGAHHDGVGIVHCAIADASSVPSVSHAS